MANLAAIVGGIGGFFLGGPAGAAAGAALGSKLSGSSDENALKDGLSALGLAVSPVGGALKGAASGYAGVIPGMSPGAAGGSLGGVQGAITGAKAGFSQGVQQIASGKGLGNFAFSNIPGVGAAGAEGAKSSMFSPGGTLLGLTALGALGGQDQTGTVTERFPGGERDPNYQAQTLVRPFRSKITGKRYFTLEDMLRDEGKDVPEEPVGIASAVQPTMAQPDLLQVAMNNPQVLGSSGLPGMLMANEGGYIEGPGTGRSDEVKAGIFQNGQKVQEARLSDGEFVMTRKAVDNAGGGDREKGAAKMYALMNSLENRKVA